MSIRAYVGLGSNLGHPRRRLARALYALSRLPRTRLVAASPNYVSAPVGVRGPQPDYLNAVVLVSTALGPGALLRRNFHSSRNNRPTPSQSLATNA